jgi:cell division protein FtsX
MSLVSGCLVLGLSGCASAQSDPDVRTRVTVFLEQDVAADKRGAIEAMIRDLPGAGKVTRESPEEAYERLKESFRSAPDLVAATNPDFLPESFLVSLPASAESEAAAVALKSMPGVADTVITAESLDRKSSSLGFVLYLKDGGSSADREAIDAKIRDISGFKALRYESRDQAYRRLRRAGGSRLAPRIDKRNVPASFRVEISRHSRDYQGISSLREMSAVESLIVLPVPVVMG